MFNYIYFYILIRAS